METHTLDKKINEYNFSSFNIAFEIYLDSQEYTCNISIEFFSYK